MKNIDWTRVTKAVTRDGRKVYNIQLILKNSCGRSVTFPVKGSIFQKGKQPVYQIWRLDGRADVLEEKKSDIVKVFYK